jgi:peptidylprolyl isomerase
VALVAVAGLVAATGPAGAAPATAARKHPGPIPVVRHAGTLATEPVVEPTKGKPPKKLEVKDLVVGTGARVTDSSTVSVVYVGAYYKTGKDFTKATWTSHRATTFPLSGVVLGFREGLVGMKVGGRREIVIPPKLGYGDKKFGPIPANSTLVFVVDLKAVSG